MKKQTKTGGEATINFRVSAELREEIAKAAANGNTTISRYMRNLMAEIHEGTYCAHFGELNSQRNFILSQNFFQLMVWIYSKEKNDEKRTESDQELRTFAATLKQVHQYFDPIIVREFDKVLFDILRVLRNEGFSSERYEFGKSYEKNVRFNAEMVKDYFLSDALGEIMGNYIMI